MQTTQMRWIIFSLFMTPCISNAQASSYISRHIAIENGLLTNKINCIYQESGGFIWLCTNNGLQKYDGSRFINYQANLKDSEALHSSVITYVFEDSKKRFWVAAPTGMYLMNRSTGKFYNYALHVAKGEQVYNGPGTIKEDGRGDIWFANAKGYFKLNKNTNRFEDYSKVLGLSASNRPGFLSNDDKGNIWFVTNDAIKCYDIGSGKIVSKENNPGQKKIFSVSGFVTCFLIDGNNIWYGFKGSRQLYHYNLLTNTSSLCTIIDSSQSEGFKVNSYFTIKIENLIKGPNGMVLAVLPGEGIMLNEPGKEIFKPSGINKEDPSGITNFSGINVFTDKEGSIWVTGNNGLNIFTPARSPFNFYGNNPVHKNDDPPAYVASAFIQSPADGDIYVGYYHPAGGIVRYSSDLKFKRQYLFKKNGNSVIGENQIWSMCIDKKGVIWAPNQARSILKIDTKNDKLTLLNDSTIHENISDIKVDEAGNLWFGTWSGGLQQLNYITNKISSFLQPPSGQHMIPKQIYSFCFDGDSLIWAGASEQGLLKFDRRMNRYTRQYVFDEHNIESISSNIISKIVIYNRDTLLLATTMGVNIFDRKNEKFIAITAKDGLPEDIVHTIELDSSRNLWVACEEGFCKINIQHLSVTKYGSNKGIFSYQFNDNPFYKLSNGHYLVGGVKGFMEFNPSEITANAAPPNPLITGFKVFDKEIPVDSIANTKRKIRISYKENSISIDFASLLFSEADKLIYYYQLEGVDNGWIKAGNDQTARYHQLKSGNYTFKVKCVNNDGVESAGYSFLKIGIIPPFWKTWWFISLAGIAVTALTFLYFKAKMDRRLAGKNLRDKIARDLHDDVGSTLSGINLFSKMALQKMDNHDTKDLVEKIAERSESMVNAMNDIVWSVNPVNDSLDKVIIRMRSYTLDMLEEQNIRIIFKMPGETAKIKMSVEVRKDFYLIYKEAINNIAKYAKATEVTVRIELQKNKLVMQIADNGIGFDTAQEAAGNGLKNMNARARNIQARFQVQSAKNKGTLVVLEIPA